MQRDEADVLRTEALSLRRPQAQLALEVPPLRLGRSDAVALLGASGAGKTTLLAALFGLLRPPQIELEGARSLLGTPMAGATPTTWRQWRRHALAFVPQDARAALDPMERLGVQMVELSGVPRDACLAALRALGEGEPEDVAGRYPHQVSGGQAQRVLLAVALARAPALLVADEPTASLDRARQGLVLAALSALRAAGTAVLVATHDVEFARALGATALRVEGAAVREGWPPPPCWPRRPAMPAVPEPLLRAHGLSARRGRRIVFRDVDLDLASGEIVAVLGPSGAGKTTLALALAGLLRPAAGRIEHLVAARPQLLFQDAYASLTPARSLGSLACETAARARVADLARGLGFRSDDLARPAAALSGGERRRAALLRALTVRPRVLLLDEPTASLDASTAAGVLETVLHAAAEQQAACMLVTHDHSLAAALAHRVFTLEDGRLVPTP